MSAEIKSAEIEVADIEPRVMSGFMPTSIPSAERFKPGVMSPPPPLKPTSNVLELVTMQSMLKY